MISFLASVFLASSLLMSHATMPSPEKTVTFDSTLQPEADAAAGNFKLTIEMEIKQGWHTCAEAGEGPEQATTLELNLPEGVKTVGDWNRPAGMPGAEFNSEIHVGTVTFSRSVVVDSSAVGKNIQVVVSYQACNDEFCNPPQTRTISITIPENATSDSSLFESPVRINADGAPLNTAARKRFPSPGIFDVDGDGQAELLIGELMGSVGVYENLNTSGTGDPEWSSRKPLRDAKGKQIKTSNW